MPEAVIEIRQIVKNFQVGDSTVRALRGVDLTIERGSFVAIMGPSGSGKSTLLNILGCLDRPTSGKYFLGPDDVAEMDDDTLSRVRGKRLGFIFQSYNLIAQLTVIENIQVPLIYQQEDLEEHHDRCVALAKLVGLENRLDHRPNQLSGGQQQRVAIARSLVNEPLMILADEPTGNLDSETEAEVLDILNDLNSEGKTIVMVTHDDAVAQHAHRVIHMKDGVIAREVINEPAIR
ncbi:ABC transporter ATP-binding protein [Roseibacillus persicicus]|uniref:ABC transporter ATP-binding protein n=1 Tax=Roseibacillus persicicus TaxID=454148 RepID=A0A918TCP1_9BACT|nr:ABC transporter ATP-binding protein [Roseibacillus persicicus]MDQ8190678.1 ABC transporter ATP-binding protein [Roseibacillus persicicus]GHC40990.1 ABC transporter ATP-binding protein [Roseibacillus persicicus]